MARMALTFGACPVCGDHVPRTVQLAAGLEKEIFHCEAHGRIPYSARNVPLAAMAGTVAGSVAAFVEGSQFGTGLELVA